MIDDPYDLERFVRAQQSGGTYEEAVRELERGRKTSHWMWFIFPQLHGLGYSPMSFRYGINSLEEARAYLAHPLLGDRLRHVAAIVAASTVRTAEELFGALDAMKLCSSMTLFSRADPNEPIFGQVLDRFFGGDPDSLTEALLARKTRP